MRKKVNLDQRLRRVFLGGGIAGAVAGILFTVLIANIIISGKEEGFEKQQTKLEKEIGELQSQISKYNAVHNNTDLLSGGEDGWMLVLVNETHPLDTSYIPADLYEVESERSVDARIKEPLEKMLGDAEARCRTGSARGILPWTRTMRQRNPWQCPGRASMRPAWR